MLPVRGEGEAVRFGGKHPVAAGGKQIVFAPDAAIVARSPESCRCSVGCSPATIGRANHFSSLAMYSRNSCRLLNCSIPASRVIPWPYREIGSRRIARLKGGGGSQCVVEAQGRSVPAGENSGDRDAVDQAVARADCRELEDHGRRGDVGEGEGGFAVAAVVVSEKGEKGYIV